MVSPGDILALQHDAGPASLLHCQPSPRSPWRQPVLITNLSEWFLFNNTKQSPDHTEEHVTDSLPEPELDLEVLVRDGEGAWMEDAVCPVRVLYVGQSETQLQGAQLSTGLSQPGLYSLLVRLQSSVSFPSMHLTDVILLEEATYRYTTFIGFPRGIVFLCDNVR